MLLTEQVAATEKTNRTQDDGDGEAIAKIEKLDKALFESFGKRIVVDANLNRKLVSFQANKSRSHYKWYKYKEAFSAGLVEYLLEKYELKQGTVLDPFAGAGTALFSSAELGYQAEGIEVLPVGQEIIKSNIFSKSEKKDYLLERLKVFLSQKKWNDKGPQEDFSVLKITTGAYPENTQIKIQRYLFEASHELPDIKNFLVFALLCVLESISYTRKDGQYLRWDLRSGRRIGKKPFNKGKILDFDIAITEKILEIVNDLESKEFGSDLFSCLSARKPSNLIKLLEGSCLEILPMLKPNAYVGIITSPPYCNRYDYTRTYALEHAMLGIDECELIKLRQAMLSCTVENKAKNLININPAWKQAIEICDNMPLLQEILSFLDLKSQRKELNNTGIARMVRGYFYEMACVIQELYRLLQEDAILIMVNDNVRYAGVSISVDLILSSIAQSLGYSVENILMLPQGKGNSSQQMGRHGRDALRKCVYVWRKK